ncbi:MAG: universal stress protein [Catenulispora sp.]|nr:universal stress protein [Catenulispora sp.]
MNGAVIVGYDETVAAERALALAAYEARLHGVPLEIVNVVHPGDAPRAPGGGGAERSADWILGEAEHTAHEADPMLPVERLAAVGRAEDVLAGETQAAEMLVLGHRAHRDFAELREGAVTVHALEQAACPVLVLCPGDHEPRHRMTVAVDLDRPTDELLGFAFEEAARRGAALRVLSVCDSHVVVHRMAFDADEIRSAANLVADREQALEQAVEPWRERYPDVAGELEVATGSIGRSLVEATADGDLLVLGGRRHEGGRPGMEIGPAVHLLLHHAECPMAVVPIG